MTMHYEEVKKDFLSGKIKSCKAYFENNNYYVEAGYCCIVLDELDKAKELFQKVQEVDTRAKWGLILLQMIKGDILTFPTYFQIRNFLELDLSILILYCKGEYVEKIIRYADFMAYYNPECYKFIGRAFWANNLMSAAMFFLRRAKDKFYQDPELHYLLAYIFYHNDRNIDLAKKALGACLGILPEYAPAKKLYAQIVSG